MSSITSRTYPPGFIKQVREQVARVIATSSAHDVPSICRRYGIGDGEVSEAFTGKFKFVNRRLQELGNDRVIGIAQAVSQDEGDAELGRLLDSIQARASTPLSGIQPSRRVYYSERNRIGPVGGKLELAALITLFKSEYVRLDQAGYFAEHFGFWCVDVPERIAGTLGADVNARMLFSLNKADLWPIDRQCDAYSEDDLFSVIEYLFDHVTKPVGGTRHPYFEDADDARWLFATVQETNPAALVFHPEPPDHWDEVKAERIKWHFGTYKLAELYASHAAVELNDIKYGLQKMAEGNTPEAISEHLQSVAESRAAAHANSWRTATYEALAASEWFCSGGFAQGET